MFYTFWRQYKPFAIAILLILLLCIGYAAYTIISRQGKSKVTVAVAPSNSQLIYSSKGQPDIKSGTGDIWLKPGTYTVTVSSEGFASSTKTLVVEKSTTETNNTLIAELLAQSDEAKQYAQDHQAEFLAVEQVAGQQYAVASQELVKKYPISKELPIKNPYYTIGSTTPDANTYIVTIDTPSPRYRYAAIQKIRDLGYDPTDYRIQFLDYKSLLGGTN